MINVTNGTNPLPKAVNDSLRAAEPDLRPRDILRTDLQALRDIVKLNGHVDPDLFDVFMWEKVYLKYAQQCMDAHQIDEVDLSKIPGYAPPPLA